jgi:dimethylargininase
MIALVHSPSRNLQSGERTFVPAATIDYQAALRQHAAYCQTLSQLGCVVRMLEMNSSLPDSVFIEDTAVVLDEVAVLGSMGTPSRANEPEQIEPTLREFREVERLPAPARLEGGDVLRVGHTLLVGQSRRTNQAGIEAFGQIALRYGYEVLPVPVRHALHLKTACTALPDGRLLVNPAWVAEGALSGFRRLRVAESEAWAANVMLVGGAVLMSAGAPRTGDMIRGLGFAVATVDISEFAKAEGGVTCLALLISPSKDSPLD